jgi:uncharacterized membrane protein YcaP (DUF421 family)
MEPILRAAAVYFFLLAVFRITGHRTLSRIRSFDLVLLLIIAEATQQALLGNDYSMTNAGLIVLTLVMLHAGISVLKQRWKGLQKMLEEGPVVLVAQGRALPEQMNQARVDEDEILEVARASHGLERLDQIRFAVLERSGRISIVPRPG